MDTQPTIWGRESGDGARPRPGGDRPGHGARPRRDWRPGGGGRVARWAAGRVLPSATGQTCGHGRAWRPS